MNSSTKVPPPAAQKFKFDVDFDMEEERLRVESMQQAEHERKQAEDTTSYVPAPTFSEDELVRARDEAYKKGYENGIESARQSVENDMLMIVDKMLVQMLALLDGEQKRETEARDIALSMAVASIKKIWPQLIKKLGLEMIESTIRKSLEYNPEESRIVVRVHDSMLDPVVARLPQLQNEQAFAGKIIVIADANVSLGDCKIEWADGGLERLSRTLSSQLDEAMDRILANIHNPSSQDSTEIERTEP